VGPKIARRLVVELQGVIQHLAVAPAEGEVSQVVRDAVNALLSLGETRAGAEKAVRAAVDRLGPDATVQMLVEAAFSR